MCPKIRCDVFGKTFWELIRALDYLNYRISHYKGKSILRACLAREMKFFWCHIERLTGCRKGFSDTNEKTNFITRL